MIWRCRQFRLSLARPLVMGILNVTPDSFSDGGKWIDPAIAAAHGRQMAADGADIVDVGGESTRRGSRAVPPDEELARVRPVIEALAKAGLVVSVDTRHAEVARAALAAGAAILNNVVPLSNPDPMAALAAESGAGLVLMHARGTPDVMSKLTDYGDVVAEVEASLRAQLAAAAAQGVAPEQCVVDPGLGFAKTAEQDLALLAATKRLAAVAPLLIGISRKRTLGAITHEAVPARRVGASVGAALWCALNGASVLRVHDVKETRQALEVGRLMADAREGVPA